MKFKLVVISTIIFSCYSSFTYSNTINDSDHIKKLDNEISRLNVEYDAITQNIKNIKKNIDISKVVVNKTEQVKKLYDSQMIKSNELGKKVTEQIEKIDDLSKSFLSVKNNLDSFKSRVDGLNDEISKSETKLVKLNNELTVRLDQVDKSNQSTNKIIDSTINSVDYKFLTISGAILFISLLIFSLIYILSTKMKSSNSVIESKILSAKESLEYESLCLDSKLIEVLEKQLNIAKVQQENKSTQSDKNTEVDHTLSLKVADEITRMQRNISKLDLSLKGIKPLNKGLDRLRKNFMSEGYEIVDLLNKTYSEGMNVEIINIIDDCNLNVDEKVMVKIIRPQVNFNGILIQRAQVDIATN